LEEIPVDGLWLDMNEPSNFCNGACDENITQFRQGAGFDPVHPPYSINHRNVRAPLHTGTLDTDAVHVYSSDLSQTAHYNVHNLYGVC